MNRCGLSLTLTIPFLCGCVSVGSGDRTLVKRCVTDIATQHTFPEFTELGCVDHSFVQLTPDAGAGPADFARYLKENYGLSPGIGADKVIFLDASVRRKEKVPPFLYDEEYKIISNAIKEVELNSKLAPEEREVMVYRLKAKLLNAARMEPTTVSAYRFEGVDIYNYFPRIEVDFSAKFNSPDELDSIKHLGIVIKIRADASSEKVARFVDFFPKEASIVEFSRGQLAQTAAAAAGHSASDVAQAAVATTRSGTAPVSQVIGTDTVSRTTGSTLNFTYTDAFTNQLVDALEQRTTGILDRGQSFFAFYKATKNKRIAGTYTYDLMLEVSSKPRILYEPNPGTPITVPEPSVETDCKNPKLREGEVIKWFESMPCSPKIVADVYLLGVARHVYDRGMTGLIIRVPEIDNDDVYEHVVVEKIEEVELWKSDEDNLWGQAPITKQDMASLTVYTNLEDAQFGIYEIHGKERTLLEVGKGKSFPYEYSKKKSLLIEFMDVVHESEGVQLVYIAKQTSIKVDKIVGGIQVKQNKIVGEYEPK